MYNNKIKVITMCLAGSVLLTVNTIGVKATSIGSELSVAGITVSLEKYYEKKAIAEKMLPENASIRSLSLEPIVALLAEPIAVPTVEDTKQDISNTSEKEKQVTETKESEKSEYENIGIAVVDNHLNIREKAGEDAKIIGKLPKNAGCTILDIDKDGWAKIKSGKVTGYVMSTFLVTGEEAEKLAQKVASKIATVINTATLRVREEANIDSTTLTLVPIDEELEVKEEVDDWLKVTIDQDEGYVSKEFVEISYELQKAVSVLELQEDKASGVTSLRANIVAFAKQFIGNPYVWGGTSLTNGADCSGFVMSIYRNFGYSINRTSRAQSTNGTNISASNAKPGDLIFYGNSGGINHVAMCIGNGQVVHASNRRTGIKISNMYYRTPIKATRIIND